MATASSLVLSANINLNKISLLLILLLAIIQSSGRPSVVICQDSEDLNQNIRLSGDGSPNAAAFKPNRQFAAQSSSSNNNQQFQAAANTRQRPVLSTRFVQQQQQQQQLSAQASTISNTVVSNQQDHRTTTGQQHATAQPAALISNTDQILKNALARTSRLEQSTGNGPESRQDQSGDTVQSRSGSQFQSTPPQPIGQTSPLSSSSSPSSRDKIAAESAESQANTQPADESDKQTTASQTATTSGHETVYSDQRFANLFARRNNQKKSKFTPTEQVKAKPTLPSFIKSPPDPKQFNANSAESQDRPITQASTNLASARLQQQQSNQNRQPANPQKKAVAAITSNTAANANNKRLNSQKQTGANSQKAASSSRATGSQATANVTSKPVTNNPFNKSQQNSSDPANVIAMARRRLLANNAAQQQRPAANQ
jgi:hypothetical protein